MWGLFFELAVATADRAPPAPSAPAASLPAAIARRVDVYGRFDGHLAFTSDDLNVNNNGSRFGIHAEQDIFESLSVFGRGEWRISLGQGDTTYALSENPDTGLAALESTSQPALGTRLGFVGLKFGRFGQLSFGKQWGVYYDVSEWTDRFTVFGAHGSSTYNAGTDGGQTGEGRANDALAYRVGIGPLALGLQGQFHDSGSQVADALSGSLVWRVGAGLQIGAAYSHAFLDLSSNIVGYDGGDAQAFTAGVNFEACGFTLASVNTWTRNHELVATEAATVMYDTLGAELFVARRFHDRWMPYAGFDFAVPRNLDTRYVNPNFGNRDVIGGFRFLFDARADSYVYLEGRSGQSRTSSGAREEDVVTLGIRFNYSLRRALGLGPRH